MSTSARSPSLATTALVLGLAWLALAWGLVALGRVFVAERHDARHAIGARRSALDLYAERALGEALASLVADASERIPVALADPLRPATDLFLREDGAQRLPRLATARPGNATPGAALAERISRGDVGEGEAAGSDADPWAERLRIARAFVASVRLDDRAQIESRFRALLGHQARYRIDSTLDLPSRLGLLELLVRESHPDPALLHALLRDGLSDAAGSTVPGLEPALLDARERFDSADFLALADRIGELAERSGVPYEDFFARVHEPVPEIPLVADDLAAATLVARGTWLLRPAGRGRIEGARVDLDGALRAVLDEMRGRGVLTGTDELRLATDLGASVPLASLAVKVDSPEWPRALAAIERRFRWKLGLLLGSGGVAMALAALAFAFQRQGRRVVDMQRAFLAAVSHELRTPLASIRLLAETLERRVSDVAGARDYPQRIVRAADGLAFLVENLLSVQRLDRGRGLAERVPVKIDELVHRLVEETAASLGAEVRVDLAGVAVPTVWVDAGLFTVMLANLVRNACLYNARSPVRLVVTSERDGEATVIRIRDNGRGFDERDRQRAFEDFHRGTGAADRAVPGTGLGLALARRIVALHGGAIRIAATGAEGTTFEIRLPDRA